jgi:hypothetical protein
MVESVLKNLISGNAYGEIVQNTPHNDLKIYLRLGKIVQILCH